MTSGQVDDAIAAYRRAMTVNPKDRLLILSFAAVLAYYRRPEEALRIIDFGIQQLPDVDELKGIRAVLIRDFTGHLPPEAQPPPFDRISLTDPTLPPNLVIAILQELRMAHRDEIAAKLCAAVPANALQRSPMLGAGQQPLADQCGWAALLRGDRAAAAKAGAAVLDFTKHQVKTKWNRVSLAHLRADGYALVGNRTDAIEAARVAAQLARTLGNADPGLPVIARTWSAIVLAWSGATDEAVSLLEDLATSVPGSAPAPITRDPLITKPLANNTRYQALRQRLEAQMAATKL
jgi:hypothetical protein